MFKPSLSEPKKYIWKFHVRTNLNRLKELVIVSPLANINSRCDMMANYLNISRYGIPCYVFPDNSDTDPATLTHSNDKTIYGKEYCYVCRQITDKIYSITPIEYIPKPPEFNVNAPEFVPKFAEVNVQTPITKNTIKTPYTHSMPSYQPQHPHPLQIAMHQSKQTIPSKPSKLNIKQMLNEPVAFASSDALRKPVAFASSDALRKPVALAMSNALRAPVFVPSKPDIYQTGTTQFNMQYF